MLNVFSGLLLKECIFRAASQRMYFQGCFSKNVLSGLLLKECIFRAASQRMYFQGCFSKNVFSGLLLKKCIFRAASQRMYFQGCFSKNDDLEEICFCDADYCNNSSKLKTHPLFLLSFLFFELSFSPEIILHP